MGIKEQLLNRMRDMGAEDFVIQRWETASQDEIDDKWWRMVRLQQIEESYPGVILRLENALQTLTAVQNKVTKLDAKVTESIAFLKQLQLDILSKETKEESVRVEDIGKTLKLNWLEELSRIEKLVELYQ